MKFLQWLLGDHPEDDKARNQIRQDERWLDAEEKRQLEEVRERLERVEQQLERIRGGGSA